MAGDGFDEILCVESTFPVLASSTVTVSPASDIFRLDGAGDENPIDAIVNRNPVRIQDNRPLPVQPR